ncbi:hypothetical protein DPSP01_002191 [Paraphaeosphaeria sporulosa]
MGSYSAYDHAYDSRFKIPSTSSPTAVKRFLETIKGGEGNEEKHYARWRNEQDERWRARLPRKSERAALNLNAKSSSQLQSRFFQLPLEVRDDIYQYIFDGGTLRLDVQEKVDGKVVRNKEPYRLRNLEPQQCVAILQACKRTYVEAAHLLYTTHTFMFSDLTSFLCFERLVPSHHWHRIKSIGITWDYDEVGHDFEYDHLPCPTNEETWKEVCRAVSEMKGLEHLRVDLEKCPMNPYQASDLDLQQPLRDITAPIVLDLFVYGKRKALTAICGCGCGGIEGRCYGSVAFDQTSLDYESDSDLQYPRPSFFRRIFRRVFRKVRISWSKSIDSGIDYH